MTELSVIIPARNEKYLTRTVNNVLENIRADTEIIVVCDGSWWDGRLEDNPRVVIIHHTEARGQRQSINEAARIAKGKYLMKLDAHCAVGPGFDRILIDDYQEGWTVVPRMYNLDVETWTPKFLDDFHTAVRTHKVHDYMFIGFNEKDELRTQYYEGPNEGENKRLHARTELIDETMSCMGCCFFLSAETFWKTGGCDENHGSWGQQAIEVALKAWLSGGALMVNKKTWFAHWFRGNEGFPYPISGRDIAAARSYSKDLWTNNKWPGQVRKLEWLIKKFNPPGWENYMEQDDTEKVKEINNFLYAHLHEKHHDSKYRGVVTVKMPSDLLLYHRVIWETKPDVIVEIGTRYGGSALYLQDQLDLLGSGGKVVTVDIVDRVAEHDPRITYLIGNSTSEEIRGKIGTLRGSSDKRAMVILDGDHSRVHVKWELKYFAGLVSPGCFLVLEDCYQKTGDLYGPGEARDWFLLVNKDFVQTNLDREYLIGFCRGGWLKRK